MTKQFVAATPVTPSRAQQEQAKSSVGGSQFSSQEPSFCINTVVRTAMASFLCFCAVGVIFILLKGVLTHTESPRTPLEVQLSWPEHDTYNLASAAKSNANKPSEMSRKE